MKTIKATDVALVLVTKPSGARIATQRTVTDFTVSDQIEDRLAWLAIFLMALIMVIESETGRIQSDLSSLIEIIVRIIEFWSLVLFIYWAGGKALCSVVIEKI